jgi:predicted thioesterase
MTTPLSPGQTGEVTIRVTPDRTADALGNRGVHVLATPFLVGLLETAAIEAIKASVPAGGGSVGTGIDMKHLAATPVGMTVKARATVLETDGRRVVLAVEAHDDIEKVAEGTHERFIVGNLERFLERAMKKGQA